MRKFFALAGLAALAGCSTAPTATQQQLTEALAKTDATEKRLAALEQKVNPAAVAAPAVAPAQGEANTTAAVAAPAPPKVRVIPAGTVIAVRTTSLLSTKTAKTNDTFVAHLEQPLLANGVVVAPRGSAVTGRITYAGVGGRVKGKASINLTLASVTDSAGRAHAIATTAIGQVARSGVKGDAVKTGIGSGIGAAIGAITGGGKGAAIGAGAGAAGGGGLVLATRGPAAEIAPESLLRFTLTRPLALR